MARLDLDAAYALLRDNNPAMAPEVGDAEFISRVDAAYSRARERIASIENIYGYRSMLMAFGNASGDKHIGVSFGLTRQYTIWPNFLVRAQGDNYIVVRGPDSENAPPNGARLVSCDGTAASDFARQRIGEFYANWDIEAQRASQAWRLFVNDRNPFVQPPRQCRFETDGQERDVDIAWSGSTYDVVAPVIGRTQGAGRAGFGLRRLENGAYWIAMEAMDARAMDVINAAETARRDLAAAPYIVVDVRGNGGGSSSYGDQLAAILLGSSRSGLGTQSIDVWRASSGNAAAMREFAESARGDGNADLARWAEETATMLTEGVARGDRLSPRLPRRIPQSRAFVDPPGGQVARARVFILTDYSCFSSCLLMVDTFKRRGAAQIGLPTDAATRYMETRSALLPSAMASFSTLQKAALGAPYWIGPYEPAERFEGDISDTAALERWVSELRAAASSSR